ncbi:hypothetical protein EYC84_001762 [Monilinia fructicola]|uniref:Secreted protein n=1 Tax=Monilinia fructicola TaxID=38448 RepID=A0A5M9JYK2_MONFR|nr:hypothetical protein EYC84_001762 [Monilinia fructicola]
MDGAMMMMMVADITLAIFGLWSAVMKDARNLCSDVVTLSHIMQIKKVAVRGSGSTRGNGGGSGSFNQWVDGFFHNFNC